MTNQFSLTLSLQEILIRILMAIIIGGMIGYERGHSNRPAGFRTHILVCLGAAIVSLTQDQLRINLLNLAEINPDTAQLLKTDLGRIGAQVVSGIGFLGAGTIMRDKGCNRRSYYCCIYLGNRLYWIGDRLGILLSCSSIRCGNFNCSCNFKKS